MHTSPLPVPTVATPAASRPRIAALDVIRGVALCGIAFINISAVTHFAYEVDAGPWVTSAAHDVLELAVHQRFFPIFSLLFGAGASLFLAAVARSHPRSRLLLRRLLVLLPLGAL